MITLPRTQHSQSHKVHRKTLPARACSAHAVDNARGRQPGDSVQPEPPSTPHADDNPRSAAGDNNVRDSRVRVCSSMNRVCCAMACSISPRNMTCHARVCCSLTGSMLGRNSCTSPPLAAGRPHTSPPITFDGPILARVLRVALLS